MLIWASDHIIWFISWFIPLYDRYCHNKKVTLLHIYFLHNHNFWTIIRLWTSFLLCNYEFHLIDVDSIGISCLHCYSYMVQQSKGCIHEYNSDDKYHLLLLYIVALSNLHYYWQEYYLVDHVSLLEFFHVLNILLYALECSTWLLAL